MHTGHCNIQDRAHCLTGNQPLSNVTKNVVSNVAARSTFANKPLKNTRGQTGFSQDLLGRDSRKNSLSY